MYHPSIALRGTNMDPNKEPCKANPGNTEENGKIDIKIEIER